MKLKVLLRTTGKPKSATGFGDQVIKLVCVSESTGLEFRV